MKSNIEEWDEGVKRDGCVTQQQILDRGKINLNRHIWEGWTVQDFIDELEPLFEMIQNGNSWKQPFTSDKELKQWCMDNQPYYKKHIPEVYKYFKNKL